MKTIKLNALKTLAVVVLLCSPVFADGDMGSGGFTGSDLPCTTNCSTLDGDMGSGGLTMTDSGDTSSVEPIWGSILDYLDSMI